MVDGRESGVLEELEEEDEEEVCVKATGGKEQKRTAAVRYRRGRRKQGTIRFSTILGALRKRKRAEKRAAIPGRRCRRR